MLTLLNGVDEKTVGYLKANYPQSVAEINSIAQDLERGIVNFFGIKGEVDKLLGGIDPWTNERWPDDHYKKICESLHKLRGTSYVTSRVE